MIYDLKNVEVAPEWLREMCIEFLARLGFAGWQIKVFVFDTHEEDGRVLNGLCEADSSYLNASLYFSRDITAEHRATIYHECLHVVFSELEHAIDHHIISPLAGDSASRYMSIYNWHWERLLERLARALAETD